MRKLGYQVVLQLKVIVTNGVHEFTESGKKKPVPRRFEFKIGF